MKKMTVKTILSKLRALKPIIMQRYNVREIEIFGSYIRDEQHEKSDIDILVDFEDHADLFDLVGLSQFLEEKLARKVDVIPKHGLRPEIRNTVVKEALPV